jgi:hypothetical protein
VPRDDFYQSKTPTADNVLLLVEVADSSLEYEVDLVRNEVQVHREPTPSGFGFVERRRRGTSVEPIAFPRLSLSIDELLG